MNWLLSLNLNHINCNLQLQYKFDRSFLAFLYVRIAFRSNRYNLYIYLNRERERITTLLIELNFYLRIKPKLSTLMAVQHKQHTKCRISFCDWRCILQLRMLIYEVFASANCCWDSEYLTLTVTGSGPEVGPNKNSTDSLCATAINVFYN